MHRYVLVALLVACQARPKAPDAAPKKVEDTSRRDFERAAALAACTVALRDLVADPEASLEPCTRLYSDPACRDALAEFAVDRRVVRIEHLGAACHSGYCPRFDDPPSICHDLSFSEEGWHKLHAVIIAHELDLPVDDPAVTAYVRAWQPDKTGGSLDAAPATRDVVLALIADGPHVIVTIEGTKTTATTKADFARLFVGIDTSRQLIIEAGQDVPHGMIIAAIDAAKEAGLVKLAIATAPSDASPVEPLEPLEPPPLSEPEPPPPP